MPYHWSAAPHADDTELTLWPHRSLPMTGFAAVILGAFALLTLPMLAVVGTVILWGLLPFALGTVWALWAALRRSYRDGALREVLALSREQAHLTRTAPNGGVQDWECARYWARVEMHRTGGPVPAYLTLTGNHRTVEIGAFLSEEEREALYGDLQAALRH